MYKNSKITISKIVSELSENESYFIKTIDFYEKKKVFLKILLECKLKK